MRSGIKLSQFRRIFLPTVYRILNVLDQIIKDKEAFKQAQVNDPKLKGIRKGVEFRSVTVSRGLNRDEIKFVMKTDLMYRQYTKGNKVTLQLVIPESFKISARNFDVRSFRY